MDHSESPIILRLKKATTELLLLSLLDEEDMYGYQLASEIKQRSHELCACFGKMVVNTNFLFFSYNIRC